VSRQVGPGAWRFYSVRASGDLARVAQDVVYRTDKPDACVKEIGRMRRLS
jgi:hypothetical protein